jgi:acylphosphatase
MKKLHITIIGRVQGIGYREFVRQKAGMLGIKGYVKNLRTGDVEIIAHGDEKKMDEFLKLCRRGPIGAAITELKSEEDSSDEEYEYFDIRF